MTDADWNAQLDAAATRARIRIKCLVRHPERARDLERTRARLFEINTSANHPEYILSGQWEK